ncbi:unnamed protein product [Toxocara canis]|uniref:Uncharacterized protein n=1 Tax=Toxocara canis TaxID=6265 RepID=A0A183V033_TOXCA|nr:unnamed protein product [Toxocara canis]
MGTGTQETRNAGGRNMANAEKDAQMRAQECTQADYMGSAMLMVVWIWHRSSAGADGCLDPEHGNLPPCLRKVALNSFGTPGGQPAGDPSEKQPGIEPRSSRIRSEDRSIRCNNCVTNKQRPIRCDSRIQLLGLSGVTIVLHPHFGCNPFELDLELIFCRRFLN